MKKEDLTYSVNKGGYKLYYKGISFGGACTISGGANLIGKQVTKQIKAYSEDAKRDLQNILSGHCPVVSWLSIINEIEIRSEKQLTL